MEKNMAGGLQAMHFVKAFIMSALITAMLLFVCALLVLKTGMEEKTLGMVLAAVDAIGVFVGGLYLGKKSGKQKFLWGLIFGVLYFLIYLLISFLVSGPTLTIPGAVKSFAIMAVGGMIGGMVS